MAGATYSIKKNRINKGYYPGFILQDDGTLIAEETEAAHYLFIKAIDSAKENSSWGRFSFLADMPENMTYYIYAVALDEDSFYRNGEPTRIEEFLINHRETPNIKKEFMKRAGCMRFVNQDDVLLYDLQGRYLYIMLEVIGEGICRISQVKVDLQGDNFMNTFPEIYREHNSFFHRYVSVFSSIYNDFQGDINALPDVLDLDKCPVQLLPVYASWMGIDTGADFLEENVLRQLTKEAYQLNRMKGTKRVLERIGEIVLGEKILILERNFMGKYVEEEQINEIDMLYGNGTYDVTILVPKQITETERTQLLFLMDQFKPLRTRLNVLCLQKGGNLDAYSYLDMNASISGKGVGSLDAGQELNSRFLLQ